MRYIFASFILIALTTVKTLGINNYYLKNIRLNADSDSTATDTSKTKKQSLSIGVSYGTDATFFGRTNQIKYPFLTGDVIYNTKSGVFVYGSAWKVIGSIPAIDEVDLGLGYSYKLSKKIKGSISYTKFLFSDQSQIIKSASSNDINFKNSVDWFLKTSVTLDYLYGKADDFFVSISNSKYMESNWNIFDDKDYLTFAPSFNIILGTQNFVQKYSHDHFYFDDKGKYGPPPPGPPPPLHNEEDFRLANREFNFLNYSIKLPLAYNRPHYTLEASYRYSIPVNVQGLLTAKNESFFNLTFYYIFY